MQAKTVAAAFSRILHEALTKAEMEEVVARNRSLINTSSCASHDFCDANELMAEAFTEAGIDFDADSDEHLKLWNAAWDIAARTEFVTA
ncbi:hypothetical protein LJR296_007953 [Cupriavidus necator]|uniref:hypothetical protein n=1 Tax=Cupriavidus necator TaxID=106590 RepID=UPI003ECD6369